MDDHGITLVWFFIKGAHMKKNSLLIGCFAAVLLFSGCGTSKQSMGASNLTPAAQGMVVTKSGDNENTNMTVNVKHLAPANRVYAGATNYIVWVLPEGSSSPQNVGALQVDENLNGTHSTTIPYKNFKVIVTPEMSTMSQNPTGPTIFEQRVIRK